MNTKWKARIKKIRKEIDSLDRGQALYFVPGVFLVLLGLMTCAAPDLLVAFIASFFLFCGVTSFFAAWKLVQLRKKALNVLKQITNTQVVVRTVTAREPIDFDPYAESKKVILH